MLLGSTCITCLLHSPCTHSLQGLALLPHRRRDDDVPGPLSLALLACPALRELEVYNWHLDQPPGALTHLACLSLDSVKAAPVGGPSLLHLAEAAPRLEVLTGRGFDRECGIATAVGGHPCVRELVLYLDRKTWLRAIPRLPALSKLKLVVSTSLFEGEEVEGGARDDTARALRVCGWLGPSNRLSPLDLSIAGANVPAHGTLAAVGAAVGSRLQTLNLRDFELPPMRGATVRTLSTLVACYPLLEVLTLHLWKSDGMEVSTAEALSREFVTAAPMVAPLCPALHEVHVKVFNGVRSWRPRGCGPGRSQPL